MRTGLPTERRPRGGLTQTAVAVRGARSSLDSLLLCDEVTAARAPVMPLARP